MAYCEKETGKPVGEFLKPWLEGKELPTLKFGKSTWVAYPTEGKVSGEILVQNSNSPLTVNIFVEFDNEDKTAAVKNRGWPSAFSLSTKGRPRNVRISPADAMLCSQGGTYTLASFMEELEKTLIVYGTGDERASNLEAAQDLQKAIITQHSNLTVPYKSDKEVSQDDLKTHHLLLIGRPDSNSVIAQMKDALPVTFGPRSVKVRGALYAMPARPCWLLPPIRCARYSIVVIAGLGAESGFDAAPGLMQRGMPTQLLVLPARASAKPVVLTPAELTSEQPEGQRAAATPTASGSGK